MKFENCTTPNYLYRIGTREECCDQSNWSWFYDITRGQRFGNIHEEIGTFKPIRRATDDKPSDLLCYQGEIIIRHAGIMLISDVVNKEGCIVKCGKQKCQDFFL